MPKEENSVARFLVNISVAFTFGIGGAFTFCQLSEMKDNGEGPFGSQSAQFEQASLEPLTKYFGVNEGYKILLSPEDSEALLSNDLYSRHKDKFSNVTEDYLVETANGKIVGFNPASGMVYGEDAINAHNGKSPLKQLIALEKNISSIMNDVIIDKETEPREVNNVNATTEKGHENKAEAALKRSKADVMPVSENELKALIESGLGSPGAQKNAVATKPPTGVTTNQKLADIEKLRKQLKARIQKDFGYIPNAQKEIETHLGGSQASHGMATPASSNAVEVSNNQVNVMAIRETRNAVYYKDKRIPKVGFDIDGNQVSEERAKAQVKGIMDRVIQMGDYWSVVYKAKGVEKKRIAVFSDPTCPYCKKLHEYVPDLQEAGVTVYHLFYNRSMAPNTVSDPKVVRVNDALENAWCSTNPNEAIDSIYEGYAIPEASCSDRSEKIEFPGNEHYLMGRIIDMQGTPYTITEDGIVIPGFDTKGAPQPQSFLRAIGL